MQKNPYALRYKLKMKHRGKTLRMRGAATLETIIKAQAELCAALDSVAAMPAHTAVVALRMALEEYAQALVGRRNAERLAVLYMAEPVAALNDLQDAIQRAVLPKAYGGALAFAAATVPPEK